MADLLFNSDVGLKIYDMLYSPFKWNFLKQSICRNWQEKGYQCSIYVCGLCTHTVIHSAWHSIASGLLLNGLSVFLVSVRVNRSS